MSKRIVFQSRGWEDYQYWLVNDRGVLKKINELIKDIECDANSGKGKPEPLKHELSGFWSRRITNEHRLIYQVDDENIYIVKCRGHYE